MAQTIYVKGNILIKTANYKFNAEDGCLSPVPEGAEVIIPSTIVEGTPCLIIDDNFPFIYLLFDCTMKIFDSKFTIKIIDN